MENVSSKDVIEKYKKQMEEMYKKRGTQIAQAPKQENMPKEEVINPFKLEPNVIEAKSPSVQMPIPNPFSPTAPQITPKANNTPIKTDMAKVNNPMVASENKSATPSMPIPKEEPARYPNQKDMNLDEIFAEYGKVFPARGFLKVQATTARRTIPVSDATVYVTKTFPQGQYLIAELKTDQSGITSLLKLPAVSKEESETPGNKQPYTTVDIKVTHPGFTDMKYYNVPIFENIVSVQSVDFIPQSIAPNDDQSYSYVEKEPPEFWGGV